MRAIIQKYEDIAGNSLESAIESECSRDLRKGYKAIVRLAGNPAYYYARELHKGLKGIGTDEDITIRFIVNTSEVDMNHTCPVKNESYSDIARKREGRISGNGGKNS